MMEPKIIEMWRKAKNKNNTKQSNLPQNEYPALKKFIDSDFTPDHTGIQMREERHHIPIYIQSLKCLVLPIDKEIKKGIKLIWNSKASLKLSLNIGKQIIIPKHQIVITVSLLGNGIYYHHYR